MAFTRISQKLISNIDTSIKAVITLSALTCLLIVVAATALILDLRQRELDHARKTVASLSGVLADQTARSFDSVIMTLRVAREQILSNTGKHLAVDDGFTHELLRARAAGLPHVKSVFLINGAGEGVNSSRPDFIRKLLVRERPLFRYHLEGGGAEVFISGAEKANVDGQWTYYVSLPLRDSQGRLQGVIGAAIRIDYFESLYDVIAQDAVSQIMLLNQSGARLAATPRDPTRYGQIEIESGAFERLRTDARDRIIENIEQHDGERHYTAYHSIQNHPLALSVSVTEAEALAPWRRTARAIAAGAILLLLLIIATTLGMLGNLRRKEALENRLKERDSQISHLVQSIHDAVIIADSSRKITLFNNAAERLFETPATSAIGKPVEAVLECTLDAQESFYLRTQLEQGWLAPSNFTRLTNIGLRQKEREVPVEISLSTSVFQGEILLIMVFRDLSESQRAERELLETNRQLQELSARQHHVREEERTAIARELHDELGQLLTGIRMEVSWFAKHLPPETQKLDQKLLSIKGQIDQTIATVRRISSDLRPLVLDDLGLTAAATWYVNQFSERTGLPVRLDLPQENPRKGGMVATALFRVLQESLTNIARHAQASLIDVVLIRDVAGWKLYVTDDGIGFTYDPGQRSSLGLIGMRERVQILGGSLTITTAPGAGALIKATIPLEPEEEEA